MARPYNGTTNFFFNNFKNSQEQDLLENLIIEAISIYGIDAYYIPRVLNNYDSVYGADDQSSYNQAIPLCFYIENIDGFKGDGNFMSKFGLEIRDQIVLSVAQRIFNQEVGTITSQQRPNEGDLIYFPLNEKCFQIKFTDKFEMFYQMGGLQTYKLTCELFEYSNESFNTGIAAIDIYQKKFDTNLLDWGLLNEEGKHLMTDQGDYILLDSYVLDSLNNGDTSEINNESSTFIDFSVQDPFSDGNL
jgi:hypothetical protein